METQNVTIQSQQFTIPAPFLEGHVCTANEASALNQLLAENIRNNFAQKMKAAAEAGQTVPGQTELDAYAASYKFGVRAVTSRTTDPVEREAEELAWARIKVALAKKNIKLKTVTDEKKAELIAGALAKYPEIRASAQAVVAARRSVVGDLDLSAA